MRVAIVTGASGGIGRAVAERLSADGMAVVAHYSGNAAKAEEVVAAITANGGQAVAAGGDVADETAMAAVFDRAMTGTSGRSRFTLMTTARLVSSSSVHDSSS